MKELIKSMTELAPEFGFQLNENADLEADVTNRLNRAASLDEVDTVSFGLETDDGKIVKVYVAEKDADKFEEIMAQALGKVDDIEEAINLASKDVEIIDVEWPSEDDADSDPEATDDGSEVLNKQVYDNANANKSIEKELKPKLEAKSFGERFMDKQELSEGVPGGVASRLTTPNQQLVLQAILELGIPEVVLDRSPYRATIVRNVREIAMNMQRNSSMKQALRVFVKRTIDYKGAEEETVSEAILTEGNADLFWTAVESALRALDKSRKGLDAEALFNDGKYQTLKKRSTTFLNSKVGTTLKARLNSLTQAIGQLQSQQQPVAEGMNGADAIALITQLFNMADPSAEKTLAKSLLNTTAAKNLMRRIKQGVSSMPSAIKMKLDAVEKELNREPVAESLKDIMASIKGKEPVLEGSSFICRVKKGDGSFIIWQNGHYNYSMTETSQPFKKVKSWADSSLEDVKAELKKDGYDGEDLAEAPQDPEIVDAAKAVGTAAELTGNVYKRVVALTSELKKLNDGDLASKLSQAKGEEKFAMRVALKVIGRRVDENESEAATNVTITELAQSDEVKIEATDEGVSIVMQAGTFEFIEENLERLVKGLANRESVTIHDTNELKFIVSPRGRSAVLKQVGATTRIELNPEQVNDLLDAAEGSKE